MAGPTCGASRQAPAPCSRFLQDIGCGGPWLACGPAALPPVANHSSTCLHGPRLQLPCSSSLGCRVRPNQKPDLSFDHSASSLARLHPCRIRRPSGPWLHLDPCPVVLAAMLCPLTTTFPMPPMNFFVRGCISSPSTMPAGLSKMLRVMGPAASQSCSEHTQADKVIILSTLHTPYSVHGTHLTKSQSGHPGPGCCTALVRKVCRIIRRYSFHIQCARPFCYLGRLVLSCLAGSQKHYRPGLAWHEWVGLAVGFHLVGACRSVADSQQVSQPAGNILVPAL